MAKYEFWQPGGQTGSVIAKSTHAAAYLILSDRAIFCGGNWQLGLEYIGAEKGRTIKVWPDKEGLNHDKTTF